MKKEHREKLSKVRLERKKRLGYLNSEETRKKISLAMLGNSNKKGKKQTHSEEHKKKISNSLIGNKNSWIDGRTPENHKIRRSLKYAIWRKSVFERDKYICVECKTPGKRLQADHIKPFAHFPELRLELSNGRTLCVDCHRKTDTFGGTGGRPVVIEEIRE